MNANLRVLLAKATPGPWSKITYGTASTAKVAGALARAAYASSRAVHSPMTDLTEINAPDRDGRLIGFTGNGPKSPENAALIVSAVNALPALLDVAEAALALRMVDGSHGTYDAHDNRAHGEALDKALARLESLR